MDQSDEKKSSLIEQLFRHNTWANLTLLAACEGLSDEQLDTSVPGNYGSIRDTLLHIVGSEVSYVNRVNGHLPGEPPKDDEFPGFELLKHDAEWCGAELLQLAQQAQPSDIVTQVRRGSRAQYPLTGLMVQVINHSTEHRTQVATTLTQLGIQPPEMSGWEYMAATGQLSDEA